MSKRLDARLKALRMYREPVQVWTYALLAESVSIVKIGSAGERRFRDRINDVQQLCPVELVLIGRLDRNVELELHHRLADRRLHGEWFQYDDTTASTIAAALEPCRVSALAGKLLGWQKAARPPTGFNVPAVDAWLTSLRAKNG